MRPLLFQSKASKDSLYAEYSSGSIVSPRMLKMSHKSRLNCLETNIRTMLNFLSCLFTIVCKGNFIIIEFQGAMAPPILGSSLDPCPLNSKHWGLNKVVKKYGRKAF